MVGGVMNLPNFVIERVSATFLVDKYENCNTNFPIFSLLMVLSQIVVVSFLIYANTTGVISTQQGVIIFIIICCIAVVVFSVLPLVSRRSYEVHLRRGSGISVRYQTSENLRAARLLTRLMFLYVCFFLVENAYYYVIMFVFVYDDNAVQEILLSVFTILMVLEIFASLTVMATSHPSLRKALHLKMWGVAVVHPAGAVPPNRPIVKTYQPKEYVRGVDGRQLLFTNEQEKDMYFKRYEEMWNK
ncbi:hypothetical protein Q1695_012127 [Nippostrongylus brasiliensis]|nr:hypothetical protein Q1695_012127 [Nippostrongylus brasiliensis]